MHVLITGSSGQIGTNLAINLMALGHRVTGIDWRENEWTDKITLIRQDLSKRIEDFSVGIGNIAYPDDIDVVVHLAAYAKVHELVEHPVRSLDNIAMTMNALEFARARKIPILFGSSRETYGNIQLERTAEYAADFANAASPYAASKIASEALVHSYGRCFGMRYLIFRFSNVYGRFDCDLDRMERVIPLFVQKIYNKEPITVFGPDKILDFTYVDDCVAGIVAGITRVLSNDPVNTTLNLAHGSGNKLVDLAHMIAAQLGITVPITVEPARAGEVTHYIADLTAAQNMLGYAPKIALKEGLILAVEFYMTWFKKKGWLVNDPK
jgi:nucleoside-diphosphate-sugar epimerase